MDKEINRNLKQYHEGEIFCSEHLFSFSRCNVNRNVKLSELLIVLSDLVDQDGKTHGLGYNFLLEHGYVFFLAKTCVRFFKKVLPNETHVIKTWDYEARGMEFLRNYEVYSSTNELILEAQTTWICVDTATHKIIRPSAYPYYSTPKNPKKIEDAVCLRVQIPEDTAILSERKISYTDLDANGHVNNAQYAIFILDALPYSLASNQIKKFEINYSRELKIDDTLIVLGNIENNTAYVLGKRGDDICFRAKIEFFLNGEKSNE